MELIRAFANHCQDFSTLHLMENAENKYFVSTDYLLTENLYVIGSLDDVYKTTIFRNTAPRSVNKTFWSFNISVFSIRKVAFKLKVTHVSKSI